MRLRARAPLPLSRLSLFLLFLLRATPARPSLSLLFSLLPPLTCTEMASAAHQDTTIGNTPPQIVTMGTAMKNGVVRAPTTYDQTPEQYRMRCRGDRPFTNSGQCLEKKIWKWPLHHRDRCWKMLRTSWGASPMARYPE